MVHRVQSYTAWGARTARGAGVRDDAFTAGYRVSILDMVGETPGEIFEFDPLTLTVRGGFRHPKRIDAPHRQAVSLDGLIDRVLSASRVPKTGSGTEELMRRLRALHARHADDAGLTTPVYVTQVFLAARC